METTKEQLLQDQRLQTDVAQILEEVVTDRLAGSGLRGLRWSPNMPDDDPYADFLVVDSEGVEYTLEIDVWLSRIKQRDG